MFDKGVSAQTEVIFIVGGLLVLLGLVTKTCGTDLGGETSPMDKANQECEQAWVEANDGDDEEPEPIYNEPWCEQHNTGKRAMQEMKLQEDVQEATTP